MKELRPVRRHIVNTRTKKFLRSEGDWTEDPQQAFNFRCLVDAVDVCLRYHLKDVELVLRFDNNEELDVRLTIGRP